MNYISLKKIEKSITIAHSLVYIFWVFHIFLNKYNICNNQTEVVINFKF